MSDKVFPEEKWQRLVSEERHQRMNPEAFFAIAHPQADEVWADVGCGPGFFTIPLAQRVNKVIAIDISDKMLQICQQRANEAHVTNIEFIQAKGEDLQLPGESVHRVLMVNVYHEFDNRPRVIEKIDHLLKSDGKVFVIDWQYKAMEIGPPLEHRLKPDVVQEEWTQNGFRFGNAYSIYEDFYVLEFVKK